MWRIPRSRATALARVTPPPVPFATLSTDCLSRVCGWSSVSWLAASSVACTVLAGRRGFAAAAAAAAPTPTREPTRPERDATRTTRATRNTRVKDAKRQDTAAQTHPTSAPASEQRGDEKHVVEDVASTATPSVAVAAAPVRPYPTASLEQLTAERRLHDATLRAVLRQLRDLGFRTRTLATMQTRTPADNKELKQATATLTTLLSALIERISADPLKAALRLSVEDYVCIFSLCQDVQLAHFSWPVFQLMMQQQEVALEEWRLRQQQRQTTPTTTVAGDDSSSPHSLLYVPHRLTHLLLSSLCLTADGPTFATSVLRDHIRPHMVEPTDGLTHPRFQAHSSVYTPILRDLSRQFNKYSFDEVLTFFESIPPQQRSFTCYNHLIGGCLERRLPQEAAQSFEVMRAQLPIHFPRDTTALNVASLYQLCDRLAQVVTARHAEERQWYEEIQAHGSGLPLDEEEVLITDRLARVQEELNGIAECAEGYWFAAVSLRLMSPGVTAKLLRCFTLARRPTRVLDVALEAMRIEHRASFGLDDDAAEEIVEETPVVGGLVVAEQQFPAGCEPHLYLDTTAIDELLSCVESESDISPYSQSLQHVLTAFKHRHTAAVKLIEHDHQGKTNVPLRHHARERVLRLDLQERALRLDKSLLDRIQAVLKRLWVDCERATRREAAQQIKKENRRRKATGLPSTRAVPPADNTAFAAPAILQLQTSLRLAPIVPPADTPPTDTAAATAPANPPAASPTSPSISSVSPIVARLSSRLHELSVHDLQQLLSAVQRRLTEVDVSLTPHANTVAAELAPRQVVNSGTILFRRLVSLAKRGDWQTAKQLVDEFSLLHSHLWNPVLMSVYLSTHVMAGRWSEAEEVLRSHASKSMKPIADSYRLLIETYYFSRDQRCLDKIPPLLTEMAEHQPPLRFNAYDLRRLTKCAMKCRLMDEPPRWLAYARDHQLELDEAFRAGTESRISAVPFRVPRASVAGRDTIDQIVRLDIPMQYDTGDASASEGGDASDSPSAPHTEQGHTTNTP